METLSKRAEKGLRGTLPRLPAEEAAVPTLLRQQLRSAAQARKVS